MKNLWAPWRMEFIKREGDQGCFLCRAAEEDRDEENGVIFRAAECFCIMNRYPYNNGHLLVAPYRHEADLDALEDSEMLGLLQLVRDAKRALIRAVKPDGFNVGINLGKVAGAGLVGHLHLHVVPRWQGDTNFMPVLGDVRVIPQALSELGRQLREVWNANP